MIHSASAPERIKVKLLWKSALRDGPEALLRRFPGGVPEWGRCKFILDPEARDYDWLAVYDEMPLRGDERHSLWEETLSCPKAHSILVTAEPSTIKCYGTHFLSQFGHVLTSQEPWVIHHPNAIFSQPALLWFYGRTDERGSFDHMRNQPPLRKSETISTVCSSKKQTHTLHQTRFDFIKMLKPLIPQLEVFGHGVRPIADKAEALDPYRYHIAIENHVYRHHWTEKLSDSFLGLCLPFYFGCPNAEDYFPEESFIRIDINKVDESAKRILAAIRDNEYERRLPAIIEARRRVLEEYGLFAVLSRNIEALHTPESTAATGPVNAIYSRHAMRRKSIRFAVSGALEKFGVGIRHAWLRRSAR